MGLFVIVTSACGARPDRLHSTSGGSGGEGGAAGGGTSGSGGGAAGVSGALAGLQSIRLDPPSAAVSLTNGTIPAVTFKAFGKFRDGSEKDITAEAMWTTSSPLLLTAAGGSVKSAGSVPGVFKIVAFSGAIRGEAALTVKLTSSVMDPAFKDAASAAANGAVALPVDPAPKFKTTPSAEKEPSLVYPNDKVVFPPNLTGVEFHFRFVTGQELYEVGFQAEALDLKVYTRCRVLGEGCLYLPDPETWKTIATAGRNGAPIAVTLRATDDQGRAVGVSKPITISFSGEDILGVLYYWTTSGDTAIMRWDFNNTKQKTPETVITPKNGDGSTCVGCHNISRDGKRMVASVGGQRDGRVLLFDVAKNSNAVPFPLTQRSQFESWNPDGSQFVGIYGDDGVRRNLLLFDGLTGAMTGEIDVKGMWPGHPDWSADGSMIAFTDIGMHNTDQQSYLGQIALVKRTAPNAPWSAPEVLVPRASGTNHYYPAIAPTNAFLAFNTSKCGPQTGDAGEECNFDMDPSARIYALPLGGSAKPIDMKNLNDGGKEDGTPNITTSFPRWAPFVSRFGEGQDLLWLTFASKRAYGLRHGKVLVWMAAVYPGQLASASDPSAAAFVLPFQDVDSENHVAQWTQRVPAGE